MSASLGCAEGVPENREGAEGVVEVAGGNKGFGTEEEPVVAAVVEGGKDAKGFALVLGAEEETPTPANGFDFGALSFLSVFS